MENTEALPWYRSTIIVTMLVSLVTKALVVSGVISEIAPEDTTALANTLVLVFGGIADIWAMRSRVIQRTAPKIVSSGKVATLMNTSATLAPVTQDPLADIPDASDVLGVSPATFESEESSNG